MRLVVTGGGTGGHLFPGIALAVGVMEHYPGSQVLFIGTRRHIDQEALLGYDFEQASLQCLGLKGLGMAARLRALFMLPGAVLEARRILKKFQPDLVFGVGGYVTGPVLVASRLLGIPSCIHEQNSIPGLANRMAGRLVDRIFTSFPADQHSGFPLEKTVLAGNPVRREILALAETTRPPHAVPVILVLGGSQGAHRVNELAGEAAYILKEGGLSFRMIHQTGQADAPWADAWYQQHGVDAQAEAFFRDMAAMYEQADLVISRAGATTLAELAVLGLPAILIPFPHAADNHQEINARLYASSGAARMLVERECSGKILAEIVEGLLRNPESLHTMGAAMRRLGRPQATSEILQQCKTLQKKKRV